MKKMKVVKKEGYDYTLEFEGKEYIKNIEFYDVDVEVGDYIFLNDNMLNEKNMFTYGPVKKDATIEDAIKIVKDDKEIILQRYYG